MSSNSNPALLLDGDQPATVVTVHPLVLMSVLDHHTRRQEANGRVIGTLLGRRNGSNVEITNCFAVPHAERGDNVSIGSYLNEVMMRLHRKVNRKEVVVGWYASVSEEMALVADTSSAIHDFYTTHAEEGDPIHLVVDTRLVDDSIQIRGYTSSPVLIQNEPMANLFHEVRVIVQSSEAEAICLHEMQKQDDEQSTPSKDDPTSSSSDISLLQVSMEQLLHLLETTSNYVDDVVAGKRVPDQKVGREIADVLAEVPRIKSSIFEKVFHENLQDLLMVTYLSTITRTQLDIAEKLHASLGI